MLTKTFQIKTTRNISKPLWQAIKDNQVGVNEMAEDLKTSKQNISNHSHGIETTPANAVEYATYLHDPKFNQQMAAIYFEAISMFDPSKWAKQFQNAPYATWFQLREIEKKRIAMGEDVFAFAVNDHHKWTAEQKHLAHDWMIDLLKTISLSTLMAKQFSEVADYDMVDWSKQFNQEFGGVKYE
ncbi:hypothetical protein EFM54_10230 [Lentilactobacillus buchneri]|uniref:hypothetical protein n=1 Tax=Lentilactobacillus buchneri TaxID=1581 RepID=UPI0021A499B6|nr:hypothetical protein [Lentilactobacillus buchneri]MCT2899351.1 hypothetical protein [Lentilactobacillus buchneri]